MTDPYSGTDPKNETEEFDLALTSELYSLGKDKLYQNDYLVEPEGSGRYAFHKVYHLEYPKNDGIDYPDNFKVWREVSNNTTRELLHNIIAGWNNEELVKFWWPFVKPNKNKNSPIYTYTEILLYEKGIQEKKDSGSPFLELMTPKPILGESKADVKALAPKTWVPLEEWFPDSVKVAQVDDILTIFPRAERDLLALIVGRAVVGRSNHLPPGWSEPIKHTSRMAALTLGEDPGLGKTTLFKNLFSALETVGYVVETFDNFGAQFNMGAPITSHILYKDDLTDGDLKKLVQSGVAKSIISGSDQIKVQDKGVDAHNVFPRTTIIANTNNFNPRLIWGIDPGFADRLKLISTYREAEISEQDITSLSKGSPDLRPFAHFPYLAQKLGVSVHIIMLWFARLCADKFLETLSDRTKLENEVDRLSISLREPLHKDSASQLFTTLLFFGGLSSKKLSSELVNKPKEIGGYNWEIATNSAYDLMSNRKDIPLVFKWLKDDFDSQEKPDFLHPFIGATLVDPYSLKRWHSIGPDKSELRDDPLMWLKECLKCLRMRNGLHYSQDEVWITKAFHKIYYYIPEIYAKIKQLETDLEGERILP